jgi:hypothetical protein
MQGHRLQWGWVLEEREGYRMMYALERRGHLHVGRGAQLWQTLPAKLPEETLEAGALERPGAARSAVC